MATIREKRPGGWEVRVFTGRGPDGKPTQTSRTVRGGKREARRVANDLERAGNRSAPAGRTIGDALDAWIAQNLPTWAASSACDQQSRVRGIKRDPIVRIPLARLSVSDVERWHERLRRAGVNDPAIRNQHTALRAALSQAVRWGWVSTNAASLARLRSTKAEPRQAMSLEDVHAVLAAAGHDRPVRRARPSVGRCGRRAPGRAGRVAVGRRARRFAHDRLRHRDRPAR